MSTPPASDGPEIRAQACGPRTQVLAGVLLTFGPVLVTFGLIWGLAWVLAERTPLARAPEWLSWSVGTAAAAFIVFGVPLGLLMWGFRNYKG